MFLLSDDLSLLINKPYFASKSLPLDSLKTIPDYLSIAFWQNHPRLPFDRILAYNLVQKWRKFLSTFIPLGDTF